MSARQDSCRKPHFSLNSLLWMGVTLLALVFSSLVALPLPNTGEVFSQAVQPILSNNVSALPGTSPTAILFYAQIPVALFIGAFFGSALAPLTVLLYLVLGLTVFSWFGFSITVFPWQGDINLYQSLLHALREPAIGYLMGLLVGSVWMSRKSRRLYGSYSQGSVPFLMNLVSFVTQAVLLIHGVGLVGLILQWLTGVYDFHSLGHWAFCLTLMPIVYDWLLAIVACALARMVRVALWPVLY